METVSEIYDDAWIFLIGGSNNVGSYLIDGQTIDPKLVKEWGLLLEERKKNIESIGSIYLHVVAPEKLSVYPEKCQEIVQVQNSPAHQIERMLPKNVIESIWLNPVNFLTRQKEKYLVYSKTDSHWNFYGAYCVYQLIQARFGLEASSAILKAKKSERWTVMDLGSKYDPPLKERVYFYQLSENVCRVYANELVEFKELNGRENDPGLHVGSYVVFKNSAPVINKKMMLFGDSFSEYRGHLLTGLLSETYAEVHFIWSSSLDYNLIKKVKPDIVISELAERFMVRTVPKDDLEIEGFASGIIENYK